MLRHILPNIIDPLIVQAAIFMVVAIYSLGRWVADLRGAGGSQREHADRVREALHQRGVALSRRLVVFGPHAPALVDGHRVDLGAADVDAE